MVNITSKSDQRTAIAVCREKSALRLGGRNSVLLIIKKTEVVLLRGLTAARVDMLHYCHLKFSLIKSINVDGTRAEK